MFKRFFDIVFALFFLLILFPFFFVAIIWSVTFVKEHPFFCQNRIGFNEKPFVIWKLKTLRKNGDFVIGTAFVRKIAIDEYLQLILVLKGTLSVVGPRPLLAEYIEKYNEQQKIRHQVKPGLTSLAIVKGGNNLQWSERLLWDVYYVNHYSFKLDAEILLRTVLIFVSLQRFNKDVKHISEPFEGN